MLQGEGRIYNLDPAIGYSLHWASETGAYFDHLFENIEEAVSDIDGKKSYTVANGMFYDSDFKVFSASGETRTVSIETNRIDSLVDSGKIERIDLIKLDIEGGELPALKGAIDSIKRFRPALAVAIYHDVDHLWRYPHYLMSELTDYSFYIRQYGYHRFETLLMAIPRERVDNRPIPNNAVSPPRAVASARPSRVLETYLQDAAARRDFTGLERRILTRFEGNEWASADLRPGPNLAGLDGLVVAESASGAPALILVRDTEGATLTVGRIEGGADVAWTHQTSVGDAVVGHPGLWDGRLVLPVEQAGAISLAEIGLDGFRWFASTRADGWALVALWLAEADAPPVLLVRDAEGYATMPVGGGEPVRLALPGTVIGVSSSRIFGAQTADRTALVLSDPSEPSCRFVVSEAGRLVEIGALDMTGFVPVSRLLLA